MSHNLQINSHFLLNRSDFFLYLHIFFQLWYMIPHKILCPNSLNLLESIVNALSNIIFMVSKLQLEVNSFSILLLHQLICVRLNHSLFRKMKFSHLLFRQLKRPNWWRLGWFRGYFNGSIVRVFFYNLLLLFIFLCIIGRLLYLFIGKLDSWTTLCFNLWFFYSKGRSKLWLITLPLL